MADPHLPLERRDVCVGTVRVPDLSPMQAAFVAVVDYDSFNELRRSREEMLSTIPVLERSDGSLWAYDDAAFVSMCHRFAPAATLHVAIIGSDPA